MRDSLLARSLLTPCTLGFVAGLAIAYGLYAVVAELTRIEAAIARFARRRGQTDPIAGAARQRGRPLVCVAWLPVCLLAVSLPASADNAPAVGEALQRSSDMARMLENPDVPAVTLEAIGPQVRDLDRLARTCIESRNADADKLDKELALLGKATTGEDTAVAKARQDMQSERTHLDQTLGSCRLLLVRSGVLEDALQSRLDEAQAKRLLARGPNLAVLLGSLQGLPAAAASLWAHWQDTWLGLTTPGIAGYLLLVTLTLLALGTGLRLRGYLGEIAAVPPAEGRAAALSRSLAASGARYAVPLVPVLVWTGFWWCAVFLGKPTEAIAGLSTAVAGWLSLALVSRVLLSPPFPARPPLPCDETAARRLDRALRKAALLVSMGISVRFLVHRGEISKAIS